MSAPEHNRKGDAGDRQGDAGINDSYGWIDRMAGDLLRRKVPENVYRWGVIQSLSPVIFFLLSVPVAFLSTGLAVAAWFLAIPFQAVTNRWKPPDADRYLGH